MSNESLVQAFKTRIKPGVSVKIPYPSEKDPALILEIKRMSPSELRAVEAAGYVAGADCEPQSTQWRTAYISGVAGEIIKRLPLIGWEVKAEGLPAFDRANAQIFLDSLDMDSAFTLAASYRQALLADEAAASGNANIPAQDSETGSSVG